MDRCPPRAARRRRPASAERCTSSCRSPWCKATTRLGWRLRRKQRRSPARIGADDVLLRILAYQAALQVLAGTVGSAPPSAEATALAADLGDDMSFIAAAQPEAFIAGVDGDFARMRDVGLAAAARCRESRELFMLSVHLTSAGMGALMLGDHAAAEAALSRRWRRASSSTTGRASSRGCRCSQPAPPWQAAPRAPRNSWVLRTCCGFRSARREPVHEFPGRGRPRRRKPRWAKSATPKLTKPEHASTGKGP